MTVAVDDSRALLRRYYEHLSDTGELSSAPHDPDPGIDAFFSKELDRWRQRRYDEDDSGLMYPRQF